MDWSLRRLQLLKATAAVSAIVASAIVLWFNVPAGRSIELTRAQFGLLVLPWLVFFASFLPLVYHSWFATAVDSLFTRLLRTFFWICVAVTAFGGAAYALFIVRILLTGK